MPAFVFVVLFFLFEHFMGRSGKTNIGHDAHIWGAIFGIVFVLIVFPGSLSNFILQVKTYMGSLFA
jgi:membrane associated rhomboid family serine protease